MDIRNWRDASAELMRPLYARERDYWLRELDWDATAAWAEVERARVHWGLPGSLAVEAGGTVRGWAYCLTEGDGAHLGSVVADAPEVTAGLVDACLAVALRAPRPLCVSCFGPDRAADLDRVLRDRGFQCETYHYMRRAAEPRGGPLRADTWRAGDVGGVARLFHAAYGKQGRHFAPRGTMPEWEAYAHTLVTRTGCGVLDTAATRLVRGPSGVEALVLATRVAPETLHLAQVAVHPARRRQGLARKLVEEACCAGAAEGAQQVTLLVGDTNQAARALYRELGFVETARFVAGILDA